MAKKSSEATTPTEMSSNVGATTPGDSDVTTHEEMESIDLLSDDGSLDSLYSDSDDDGDETEDQPTSDEIDEDDDEDDESPDADNSKGKKSDDGELSEDIPDDDDEDDEEDDNEESDEDNEDDFESDEKVESIIDELIDAADDDQLAARKKKGLLKLYDRQKRELSDANSKLEGLIQLESRLNDPALARETLQQINDYYAKHHNWNEDEQVPTAPAQARSDEGSQDIDSLFALTEEEQEMVDEMSTFERRTFEAAFEAMKRRMGKFIPQLQEIQAEKQTLTERQTFNQKIKDSIRGVNKFASETLGFKVSEVQLAEAVKKYPSLSMNEAVTLMYAKKIKSSATKAVVTSNKNRIPDMPRSAKTKPRQSKHDSFSLVGDVNWDDLANEP